MNRLNKPIVTKETIKNMEDVVVYTCTIFDDVHHNLRE